MSVVAEGCIVEIDAEDSRGHEQRDRRPGGKTAAARNALEVPLPAGLRAKGVVLAHHVRTIDLEARNAQAIDSCPRATLLAVRARLKTLLGL